MADTRPSPALRNRTLSRLRSPLAWLAVAMLGALAASCAPSGPAAGPSPALFFTAADIPALRARVKEPAWAPAWNRVLADARACLDPSSQHYVTPEKFTAIATARGVNDATHLPGRKLTVAMQTLGLAWIVTGDETFSNAGVALLEAGASDPVTAVLMRNQFDGARGDMMRALAIGLDLFANAPALTPARRAAVVSAARRYIGAYIAGYSGPKKPWWAGPHNFSGVCGGALGLLAIALRDDCPRQAPAWIDLAENTVLDWLDKGVGAEGAGFEGIGYLSYGLTNSVLFADALWRVTGSRRAIIEHPHFRNITRFLAMERLPGENAYDARNDSLYDADLGGRRGMGVPWLLPMATGFHGATAPDPLAAWLWNTVKANANPVFSLALTPFDPSTIVPPAAPSEVLPAPFGQDYADRGLCVWRTGWDSSDVMFSIEAGPYHAITHNQADKGHFTLYGLGQRWAADVGYGNNSDPDGRCQTVAHSCVLIDGKGQALSGAGLGTDGQILSYANTARYGYALIDAKSAYDANNMGAPGAGVQRALRHAFFFRPADGVPAYAVVLDDIQSASSGADGKNTFTWQMITWANMTIDQPGGLPSSFVLTPTGSPAPLPHMVVALDASAPLTLSNEPYHPDDIPGRPPYDYKRLRADARAVNPRFAALLAPLPAGCATPGFSVERTPGGGATDPVHVIITWPARTDTILWQGDTATLVQ